MKIWLYCSYSGSPTGFRFGCVDADESGVSDAVVKVAPHRLLDRCFSYQGITKAYGRIPGTGSYIFIRPIQRQSGDSIFLNIGFETEDQAEYAKIYNFFAQYNTDVRTYDNRQRAKEKRRSTEEDDLFIRLASVIIKDQSDSNLGFRVNRSHLASFVEEIENCPSNKGLDDSFYLQSVSESQAESFASNLWLSSILGENYNLKLVRSVESGDNLFEIVEKYPDAKKKRLTKPLTVLLIIVLIAIVIIVIARMSKATGIELASQASQKILPENSQINLANEYSGIYIPQMENNGQGNITTYICRGIIYETGFGELCAEQVQCE